MYLKIFLKIILYWILIPFGIAGIFSLWPSEGLMWGIFLIIFGIFWAGISAAYLILDGHGSPFKEIETKRFVKSGPYSMSRHPIYFGYLLYTLGVALLFNLHILWAWLAGLVIILILAILENRSLFKRFPQAREIHLPLILPLKKWRVDPVVEPPFLYAFMFLIGKFIVPFFYDVRMEGKEKIPNGPYVVIANHASYPDPLFVIDILNSYVRFPITSAHYKRFSWFYELVGIFPIKRYTVDVHAIMKFTKTMKSGGIIGIFPEGERNWDGRHLEVQEGVIRLLKMSPNPILPVRIEDIHLLWPRWAKKLSKGVVKVKIGDPVNPQDYQKAFDFIFLDTFKSKTYADYRGIEAYLWQCPKCENIGSVKGYKKGFECKNCGSKWIKPTVEEVRKLHDSISLSKEILLEDEAIINGKRSKFRMDKNNIELGDLTFNLCEVQSFLTESSKHIYIFTNELFIVKPLKTSPLMWKEYFDFFKIK
ncbi:phospholipid glycerol acyltransferase [Athalassotoga saccharophila]|nr:phospholipid glycerol acyltransferase [Athalassotoga saccharophila]